MDKFFSNGSAKFDLSQWWIGSYCHCDICEKAREYQRWLRDECDGCEPATADTFYDNSYARCEKVKTEGGHPGFFCTREKGHKGDHHAHYLHNGKPAEVPNSWPNLDLEDTVCSKTKTVTTGKSLYTVPQILDIIDNFLATSDKATHLWDILCALRGPDLPQLAKYKQATTVQIRRTAFPLTAEVNGNGFAAFQKSTFKMPPASDYMNIDGAPHFMNHVRWAASKLDAIDRPIVNEPQKHAVAADNYTIAELKELVKILEAKEARE